MSTPLKLFVFALALSSGWGCKSHLEQCKDADMSGQFQAAVPPCKAAATGDVHADEAKVLLGCVQAVIECQEDGNLGKTIDACTRAADVNMDPRPRCSVVASERMEVLKPKVEEQRAKEAEAQAKAEAGRAAAQKVFFKSLASIEANTGVKTCVQNGQPPVWATCWSKSEDKAGEDEPCRLVGEAAGCERERTKLFTWCCPRLP